MELKAHGKYIETSPIERIFTQGEAYADKIDFIVDSINNGVDVSGCTFVMRTVASDGSMTETILEKSVEDSLIYLTWHVPDVVTAVAGMLHLEIIGSQDAQLIIKYRMRAVFVKAAIFGENIPVPDVVESKLAEMNELIEEARNLVTLDATLTIEGRAADAKAVGDAIGVVSVAVETVAEELKNIQTSDSSIQEVINARTGCFSDYTYDSLQQRLNAEFGACVRQSRHEQDIAALTMKDEELASNHMALAERVGQHDTRIDSTEKRITPVEYEIESARTDFDGQVWGSLAGRLAADISPLWIEINNAKKQTDELEAITKTTAGMQKKNLLKNTGTSQTVNGVTFTVNADGSVTANGTAAAVTFFTMPLENALPASALILSGCPDGGHATDSYSLRLETAAKIIATDTGGLGATIAADSEPQTAEKVNIRIAEGYTANNLTFYPMIRYAEITDYAYEQYVPSLQEQITANQESIEALAPIVTANQTDIEALKASISNLQDADVNISRNIANVNATATAANNKADAALNNLTSLTLGVHTDGLIYIFLNGSPVGSGIALPSGASGDVVGNIDSENNIILSGNIPDGTYMLKYENEDGTYTDVGTLEVGSDTPSYTNLAEPDETATGETAWNTGGWCNDSYMAGSSYAYRSDTTTGRITTNTIAVEHGDTIYIKGIKYAEDSTLQIAIFDADGNYIKHASAYNMYTNQSYINDLTGTAGEDYWYFRNELGTDSSDSGARFIRLAGVPSGNISDIIITRNEEIV